MTIEEACIAQVFFVNSTFPWLEGIKATTLPLMLKKSLSSNIWKLFLIKGISWFYLSAGILIIFLQDNGLSMKEVFLLQSIFSILLVLLEIPSGYFADQFGRRLSLILGSTLGFLGWSFYSFSTGFAGFVVAEVFLAFALAFTSGADSAMLYDTLLTMGKENQFKKMTGKRIMIESFSEGSAMALGGFLAVISLRFPFFLQSGIFFLAIPVAFSLLEPKRHKSEVTSFRNLCKIVKYAIHEHTEIKCLTMYSALLFSGGVSMYFLFQPYLKHIELPLMFFGVAMALFRFASGFFSAWAHKIEKILGRKKSLISLICFQILGYTGLGIFMNGWAVIFFLCFQFTRGFSEPLLQDYLNRLIPSEIRATTLSISSMVGRLIFAFFGPLIGYFHDAFSLQVALLMAAGILAVFGTLMLFRLNKNKIW